MATISTIKPDGTGDFTTLAAWEDASDDASSADQHAECYGGAGSEYGTESIGSVVLNGWSATSNSSDYPRIYAAPGESPRVSGALGISIESYLKFTRIEGISVVGGSSTNPAIKLSSSGSSDGCRVERVRISGSFNSGIFIGNTASEDATFYVVNNLIEINKAISSDPAGITVFFSGSSGAVNPFVYNNTIFCRSSSTLTNSGVTFFTSSGAMNLTVENNISLGGTNYTGFEQLSYHSGSKTFNNNISSDGSADDFGGTNNQTSVVASNVFTHLNDDSDINSPATDFSLPSPSLALDKGKAISFVTTDIEGTTRPQGSAYDIGAFERAVVGKKIKFVIPDSIVQESEFIADALLEGPTGHNCELIYPVTKNASCPNCIYSPRQRKSSNIYKAGGPVPFKNHTICPWCGGVGRSSRAVTEDIKLRIYWNQRDWINKMPLEVGQSMVMVIGFMTDLPKIEKCDRILLNKDVKSYRSWMCEREGEAVPHGLSQDRYFMQMLRRVAGG